MSFLYYVAYVSRLRALSLHIESTNSMIMPHIFPNIVLSSLVMGLSGVSLLEPLSSEPEAEL